MSEVPEFSPRKYHFPGPVSEKFALDQSQVAMIMGPYGSGKTTVCFFKLLRRAMMMPKCCDGDRRYKALVLRDTYRRMAKTAIRSWHKWYPPSMGHWEGGQDRPAMHRLKLAAYTPDGQFDGYCHFELEFAAVGDADVEDFMGGYEITDLYLNECSLMAEDVLTYGFGRCGRYPAANGMPSGLPSGTKFDYGVIGDLNAPEPENWTLMLTMGDRSEDLKELGKMEMFIQPGGRSPGAENVGNLPAGYYDRMAAVNAHRKWWVARMIDNKPGYSRAGKPVYESYNDALHSASAPLTPVANIPVQFGFDAGLHPAGVAGQVMPNGQLRILKEFYFGRCGPSRFAAEVNKWLDRDVRPKKIPIGKSWVDPTAFDGVDKQSGELSWVQIVERATRMKIKPAPSNEPSVRIDAVAQLFNYVIDGQHPGILISPTCKELRRGHAANYRFIKVRRETGEEFADKPDKNDASHTQDAEQYLVLGMRGMSAVKSGSHERRDDDRRRTRETASVVKAKTEFSVW